LKTCPLPKDGNPLNIFYLNIDLWSHRRDSCLLCMLIVVYLFLVVFTNVIIVVRDEDCGWRRKEGSCVEEKARQGR
jgi:hypothetical protein